MLRQMNDWQIQTGPRSKKIQPRDLSLRQKWGILWIRAPGTTQFANIEPTKMLRAAKPRQR